MNYKDLVNNIKNGTVSGFNIIYGDETYLIDNAVKSIIGKYIEESVKEINYTIYENIQDNFSEFSASVKTFPFMSEKKVIIVYNCDFLTSTGSINKQNEDSLIKLINERIETTIVLFVLKNKKPDTRKKIVKAMKDKNNIYEITKLEEGELTNWITNRFKSNQLKISASNSNYIAINCGYLDYESVIDLYDVSNEVDKIASYAIDNGEVSRQDIDDLMIKSMDSNIFKLVDYICEKEKKKANLMLEDMLENGVAEQYIIHMIARQYRLVFQYQVLSKKGYTINQIIETMKIKKFIATKLSNIAKSLTIEKTENILKRLLEIDRKIKVGEIDKTVGLELICNSF